MKALDRAIAKFQTAGKGLWGFECPEGTRFDPERFRYECDSNCAIEFISIRDGSEGRHFEADDKHIEAGLNLEKFVMHMKTTACEQGVGKVRIVIADFHAASEDEQYQILCEARRTQESERSISFQFVVCGRWSHYLVRAHHLRCGSSISPPTDSKNAFQVPYATEDELLEALRDREIVGAAATDLDRIGGAFLLEQTGGDWFLIQQAIDRVDSSPWTDSIEQIVSELESSPEVFEEINRRLSLVGEGARTELQRILRTRRLLRPMGFEEAEVLWLAGLARRTRPSGGNFVLEIASPVVDAVIRSILCINQNRVARPSEICYCRNSIAIAAYRRVADLENLLRNIIVAELRSRDGDDWSARLEHAKARAHDHEDLEEIIRNLLREEFNIEPAAKEPAGNNLAFSEKLPKRKNVTVLASAQDWQHRQRNNHAVDLQNDNIMHFLTTESLIEIFKQTNNQFYGDESEGRMFVKNELYTALAEYASIRSAVAHNQPIKLSTIKKLDALLERFLKWLTIYADKPAA